MNNVLLTKENPISKQLGLIIPKGEKLKIFHPLNSILILYEEDSEGNWTRYEHNENQQITFIEESNGDWERTTYNSDYLITSEEYSNKVKITYEYDEELMLKCETYFDGDKTTIREEYDENEVCIGKEIITNE